MSRTRMLAVSTIVALAAALGGLAPAAATGHSHEHVWIPSHDGMQLRATIYRPAGASVANPVPMILHSHGWGGSRTAAPDAFDLELDRGFGVLSFDQRGFGETGGTATVQDPEIEGRDVIAIVDYVADLDWVTEDAADDPVIFAMGGSYGGGYQTIGALTETRLVGQTRFNALAPEITWFNLPDSLAPSKVVRSAWVALLYASGLQAHADDIHVALAYGSATGQWPDGSSPVPGLPNLQERFYANSPAAFVDEGTLLDVPVLIGQGLTDNLFNLNEGWKNFERTLTPTARSNSIFIGYNGGHALPNAAPPGYPAAFELGTNVDNCSPGGFAELRLDFFDAVIDGDAPRDLVGGSPYSLMTADGDCVQVPSLDPTQSVSPSLPAAITVTGAGAPQHLQVASGPLRVAGIPSLEADVTSVGVDQRVFFALSVGATPATARVVGNNMLPLREFDPILVAERRTIELPGIAVDVPPGEHLYLTVSPVSDLSFGHGSVRTPGSVALLDLTLHLPVQ